MRCTVSDYWLQCPSNAGDNWATLSLFISAGLIQMCDSTIMKCIDIQNAISGGV